MSYERWSLLDDGETPQSLEEVRERHKAFEHWYKQGGGYRSQEVADVAFLLAAIDDLTASRDRHERDVDVFRQRWIEKCAEVEAMEKQIAMLKSLLHEARSAV